MSIKRHQEFDDRMAELQVLISAASPAVRATDRAIAEAVYERALTARAIALSIGGSDTVFIAVFNALAR